MSWTDDGNGNYSKPSARITENHKKAIENIVILKEKAKKFDELQKLWWWLDRRTHDGKTPSSVIRYFLIDAKKYFEPYKEE
jgi:G3E family GTPase